MHGRCDVNYSEWDDSLADGEAVAMAHVVCSSLSAVCCLVVGLIGCIVMAFLVGDLCNVVSNMDPVGNDYSLTLDSLNSWLEENAMPYVRRCRIRRARPRRCRCGPRRPSRRTSQGTAR